MLSPPFFVNNPPKCLEVSFFLRIFAALISVARINNSKIDFWNVVYSKLHKILNVYVIYYRKE